MRHKKLITIAAASLTALLVAAASQAGGGNRHGRGIQIEKAGVAWSRTTLSDAPKASFPAGMPTVAGDPTAKSTTWRTRDRFQRQERTKKTSNCNCWDNYAASNVGLKVLLIGADGTESGFADWKDTLTREGVPFDAIVAKDAGELTAASFANGTAAKYQAVILSNDGLYYYDGSAYVSALSQASWDALHAFELQFRIREVVANVYPQPQYGLNYPTAAGDFGGKTATVTSAGKTVFDNLVGTVLYDSGSWGYSATPLDPSFKTLVQGTDGGALVGINTNADGRQQLVSTVAQNQYMIQSALLDQGILEWVTRGVHLGFDRSYLSIHADDAFNGDDRWDTATHTTPEDVDGRTIVMTPADVTRAVNWQRTSGVRIDLAYNGGAAADYPALAQSLLAAKRSFGWINHTYTHLNLDALDTATISAEIAQNIQFARQNRLSIDATELVTGEHSGLNNPAIVAALAANNIAFTGSDASREAAQRAIGSTLTVPRHPTNIFYNVGTKAEQLDEYNWLYYYNCTVGCLSAPATWDDYVNNEVTIMLRHVTGNDVDPHYVHVSNLAEEGTMYPVLDALLAKYRALFTTPLVDPTLTQAGAQDKRQAAWAAALAGNQVTATLQANGKVSVVSPAGVDVPVTGSSATERYGSERNGWVATRGALSLSQA